MARSRQLTAERLRLLLQAGGPLTVREVMDREAVAQPTVSRRMDELRGTVVRLGAARTTRYALRRELRGEDRWPIYRVGVDGESRMWAVLHALHGGWFLEWTGTQPDWAEAAGAADGFWEGFPFFLSDARPQGYLGRLEARGGNAQALGLPVDPTQWSDDDILDYQLLGGEQLPGDLLVGEGMRQQHFLFTHSEGLLRPRGAQGLDGLAERTLRGDNPESSAGGEQPKLALWYGTETEPEHVLAKFSPPLESEVGRRWADLLAAEWHAEHVLAEARGARGRSYLVDTATRRFLIVPRFDRVGPHGRRGTVSLEAIVGAFGDARHPDWVSRCETLQAAGLVDEAGLEAVRRLASFGRLIGNTDMHAGNLAFWFDDKLPFRPAPVYDMLPMQWAPTAQGELRTVEFAPLPPSATMQAAWLDAVSWAAQFWQRVASDVTHISADFRDTAVRAESAVNRLRRAYG